MSHTPSILPIELYRCILAHIVHKEDLISLAAVSKAWQGEVEPVLWEIVTLSDDRSLGTDDIDLISSIRLKALASRLGPYVKHLTLRFQANGLELIPLSASPPPGLTLSPITKPTSKIRHLSRIIAAISSMTDISHLVVHNNTDISIELMMKAAKRRASPNFTSILLLHDKGMLLNKGLVQFLHQCPNLRSFSSSSSVVERKTCLPLLKALCWSNLRMVSGYPAVVGPFLSSPNCPIEELTVHFPSEWNIEILRPSRHFADVCMAPSVRILRIGEPGALCHPINLDSLQEVISRFPNLRELRRVPISENDTTRGLLIQHSRPSYQSNLTKLCEIISDHSSLTFISLADHTTVIQSPDPLPISATLPLVNRTNRQTPFQIAKKLHSACPSLIEIMIFPWPPENLHRAMFKEKDAPLLLDVMNVEEGITFWS